MSDFNSSKTFNKCPQGHFYQGDHCPYCSGENGKNSGNGVRIANDTVWTPISNNANDLKNRTNVIFEFDTAPDGIKRLVEIERKKGGLRIKSTIAGFIGCDEKDVPSDITKKISEIDTSVDEKLLNKSIFKINTSVGSLKGEYYVSPRTIGSIVPDTLLTQILGRNSKLDVLYRSSGVGSPMYQAKSLKCNTAAAASYGDENFQKARKEIDNNKYLSISLKDNTKKVLSMANAKGELNIHSANDYLGEDISVLNPQVVIREYGKPDEVFDLKPDVYSECLSKLANDGRKSMFFKVSRHRLAVVFSTLIAQLSEMHKKGLVHCDLKPQNILCMKDGLMPIDPINVKIGEISAGMTMNYCSPEQILTNPVSPATDIYNLGLILLSIIDGIVYGKISNYIIPLGGVDVKEVKLLTDPMIYIDYASSNVAKKEGIAAWKSFLEKCLAFAPEDRFQDIESFANEYNRLLNQFPLKNDILFTPNFGKLSLVSRAGVFKAAWVINAE